MEIIDCRKNYSNMIIDIILFRLEIRDKFGFIAQFCKKWNFINSLFFIIIKKKNSNSIVCFNRENDRFRNKNHQ